MAGFHSFREGTDLGIVILLDSVHDPLVGGVGGDESEVVVD